MKKAIVVLDKEGALALPKRIISSLKLQEGDELEIILKEGCIILQPVCDADWLDGEAEAQKDIDSGNVRRFTSLRDALRYLHDE